MSEDLAEQLAVAVAQVADQRHLLENCGALLLEQVEIFEKVEAERDAALATIDRIRNLKPTWHRGMYGAPDDMFSGISIHRALESRDDSR